MDTIYITNDAWRAQIAESAGVNRVMVDLEILGKVARQGRWDTVISGHSISDVRVVRSVLKRSLLMVRINPVHGQTEEEIHACTDAGAEVLMLPMFSGPAEVSRFVDAVAGRAKTCLLLETGAALARIEDVIGINGIDEVHIGLNDLHLALKLDFMFEIISGGLMDYMVQVIRRRGIKFGIGGVAPLGGGLLSPELILSEHVRLGSTQVILSRDYNRIFDENPRDVAAQIFCSEIRRVQRCVDQLAGLQSDNLVANSRKLKDAVANIVSKARVHTEEMVSGLV